MRYDNASNIIRGYLTKFSRAIQNILSKFVYCRNCTSYENFKPILCTCVQSHALDTRTQFQFEILTINVITGIVYFREIILESSRNVNEALPCKPKKVIELGATDSTCACIKPIFCLETVVSSGP